MFLSVLLPTSRVISDDTSKYRFCINKNQLIEPKSIKNTYVFRVLYVLFWPGTVDYFHIRPVISPLSMMQRQQRENG